MFLAQGMGVQAEGKAPPTPATLYLHHPRPPRTLGKLLNPPYCFISRDGSASRHTPPQQRVGRLARHAGRLTVWGWLPATVGKTSQAPGEKPPAAFSSIADLSSPRKPAGGPSGWSGVQAVPPGFNPPFPKEKRGAAEHTYKSHK